MGLFSGARVPPPAAAAPNAAQALMSAQHTSGIYADMTVDGDETGTLVVVIDRAKNLPNLKTMGKQDPYCAARLGKEAKKTDTDRRGGQTPKWDQELRFTVRDGADYGRIKISVFNDDKRTDLIGETWVMLDNVYVPGGGQADSWYNLTKGGKYAGEIRIELTYYDTRPKQEKPKKTKQVETEDVQRAAVPGPRELPSVKRRPLPSLNAPNAPMAPPSQPERALSQPPETASANVPPPLAGPRSYHTPPRHVSDAYEDEFPTPVHASDYRSHETNHMTEYQEMSAMQHPHSRSMPDMLSSQFPEAVEENYHDEPRVHAEHRHSSFDAYETSHSQDNSFSEDDSFAYANDPYALEAVEAMQDRSLPQPYQPVQTLQHSHAPPRHDRIQALASQHQQPQRPLPHPSHSAPAVPGPHELGYPNHQADRYHQSSYAPVPQREPDFNAPRRAQTYDDYGLHDQHPSQEPGRDSDGPPPPPMHRNSIPPPQAQTHRPQPAHYNSQPVRPVATPPYPRNRDTWDPSSQHASALRNEYASVADPYNQHSRPQQQPPLQTQRYYERRRSAEPDYEESSESLGHNPYGRPAPQAVVPHHRYAQSHSTSALPRPGFQHSGASSAALRTPQYRSISREPEEIHPAVEERGRSPEMHRATASNVPIHKPQPRAGQLANQPIVINGTVALGTRASPLYSSPNPSVQRIARRSVSPNATVEASGSHFSPDSYNIYNPNARSSAPDSSPSAHRSPSPMYSSDVDGPSPDPSPSQARTRSDGNVIMPDGRVIHPSDHLPSSNWAPEPEPKNKRPTVAVNIKNRFGPRDARSIDGPSNVGVSPLAGAAMRKPAESSAMSNPPVRVRRMGPLGQAPGRENRGAPPPIPAKVPLGLEGYDGNLADEMAKIDLGPRKKKLGWGTGNRWGV